MLMVLAYNSANERAYLHDHPRKLCTTLERVRSSGIDPKQSQITSTTNIIAKNLVLIVSIVELLERGWLPKLTVLGIIIYCKCGQNACRS